ncbi:DUF4261 domain-containing protein [Paenibacillus sp. FSL R5-0407]|uniref:DUF4261 domain-containing protein n=1 Tax=Paenibacillus TaxID=44249 RepID=UPI0025B653BB|nr:DUF4261 domain-containing protein [Paenibacillus vini]MDN4067782.1 DUF4261 domain-containing protein [Paenibacillus vini]
MESERVLQQNLDEKSEFQRLFQMYLLFEDKVERPNAEVVRNALESRCGKTDTVSPDDVLSSFAVEAYKVAYQEGELPAQVMMADVTPFKQETITDLERTQFWTMPDAEDVLQECHYKLLISDFMAAGLDYKSRSSLLADWLEAAVSLFPTCKAIWIPSSGKLLYPDEITDNPFEGAARFLQFGMNIRYFTIHGTEDSLIDSLGLFALGLPDVQYHFHTLDPNEVSQHAFNVAAYLFEAEVPVSDGETIAGLLDGEMAPDVQWPCRFEMALIQPSREVMDVCPVEYAAGGRE